MKLTLLESGVLDYKGDGLTLATPNAVPVGAIGVRVKGSTPRHLHQSKFEQHVEDCPQCGKKLCEIGEKLAQNL